MSQFLYADVYGQDSGFNTTRDQVIPEQNDQEALADSTAATSDVHTEPAAKRNIILLLIAVVVILILFSVKF